MTMARWADLGIRDERSPDVVTHMCSGGHEEAVYLFDEVTARRLIERCYELGGTRFRVSPELAGMLVGGHDEWAAWEHGFTVICDRSLPSNTVIRADVHGGES